MHHPEQADIEKTQESDQELINGYLDEAKIPRNELVEIRRHPKIQYAEQLRPGGARPLIVKMESKRSRYDLLLFMHKKGRKVRPDFNFCEEVKTWRAFKKYEKQRVFFCRMRQLRLSSFPS
jgi:hypothetical protein